MKTIIVSLDEETYRRARMRAGELGTSVSALVKRFRADTAAGDSEATQLEREEARLREAVPRRR